MLKYFGFALILVATTLAASLSTSYEEPVLLKNDLRIVGGHEVNIAKHPHQISMRRKSSASMAYSHTCGGSIYKANVIITAAHCIYNRKAKDFIIVAGTNNRNGADGAVARVSKIIMHENYNPATLNNDVALMILSTPLPLNGVTIASITLAPESPKQDAKSFITGWGTTSPGGDLSNKLLEVQVPIVSNDRCDALYGALYGPGRITDSMICAGVVGVGGKDACQVDSGGPLVVNHQLAGVVSWGYSCGLPNYPGVYANVAAFKSWIEINCGWRAKQEVLAMDKRFIVSILYALCAAVAAAPEGRIIGGREVDIIKHPYLVSIRFRTESNETYTHKCAGAIYSERVVVTAAQCVVDINDNAKIMVVAGANSRTGLDGLLYPALKWISHSSYSSWTVDYDIGLIIIDNVFDFKHNNVNPISIRESRPIDGKVGTVAGWGYREEFGPSSSNLEEVKVPIIGSADCTKSYGVGEVTERMICAGNLKSGGKDACQGDTGGPLVVDNQLVGLVSWGRGCARPGYPSVYTFVSALKQWIDDTIVANVK